MPNFNEFTTRTIEVPDENDITIPKSVPARESEINEGGASHVETRLRRLVTIEQIDQILPIENADKIELAIVKGWRIVIEKGLFEPGDVVAFFEIDSFLPLDNPLFADLEKYGSAIQNGVKGHRLKTAKFRGQISQGMILPIQAVVEWAKDKVEPGDNVHIQDLLGVVKWNPSLPEELVGKAKGYRPAHVKQTSLERIQNVEEILTQYADEIFTVSQKLDGYSMSVYVIGEHSGVCSGEVDLIEDDSSVYWQVEKSIGIIDIIKKSGRNLVLQGELVGPGVRGNKLGLEKKTFMAFGAFDIDNGVLINGLELIQLLADLSSPPIEHAPIVSIDRLSEFGNLQDILGIADAVSKNNHWKIEGLVFANKSGTVKFKAISNNYLLKHGDD